MLYRKNAKNGDNLSQLGFGCMRFPKSGGRVDMEKTTALIKAAVEAGVNYFDTAYIYPGSEQALGKILAGLGLRDKVMIATKLPIVLCKTDADLDKFFTRQLERLQTDRIDYYLMHMLGDIRSWERLKSLGIIDWIEKKKAAGAVKNIGFSFHGGKQAFKEVVDAYNWDFCMIQYNYIDENNQASRDGLQYASRKGLPVFVMEPLRGGMLVNGIPPTAKTAFDKVNNNRSLAEWALKWVWNQAEVTMLLSGMSDMEQLKGNLTAADTSTTGCLSNNELKAYAEAVSGIRKKIKIPCTGCSYCMPCPSGVDIPTCFTCYNESFTDKFTSGFRHYFMTTGMMSAKQTHAGNCSRCRKCEKQCPQGIEISKRMTDVDRRFGSAVVRGVMGLGRKIMGIK